MNQPRYESEQGGSPSCAQDSRPCMSPNMPFTMLPMLKIHTEEEWEAVRPIIERLYLRELRPLCTVMRTLEANYQFKASVAMYKRRLRSWGYHKNARPRAKIPVKTTVAITIDMLGSESPIPRYLVQNTVDESLHTVFDLINPCIAHTNLLWWSTRHHQSQARCPLRAMYIYDEFIFSVASAASAFESGDSTRGGRILRKAFIHLEDTLAPAGRSEFTMDALLFALAILGLAKLFTASKLLLQHATDLVLLRLGQQLPTTTGLGHDEKAQNRDWQPSKSDKTAINEHGSHPFPQILKRLRLLAVELQKDTNLMVDAFFLIRLAYRRASNAVHAGTIASAAPKRDYIKNFVRARAYPVEHSSEIRLRRDKMAPVFDYLMRLYNYTESNSSEDNDDSLVNLEEIISVQAFLRHKEFENSALKLLEKMEKRKMRSQRECAGGSQSWCHTDIELGCYYRDKGDLESCIVHLSYLVPDTVGTDWQSVLRDEWKSWNGGQ
ncbi:Clr5 domain-containing protein [Xylariales sp. PMI_506]|nr:Clr5 domain-containing protein [Xylariales sp. PMI_506]